MSEVELLLVNEADNCTIYTIQFLSETDSEFERFYNKFKKKLIKHLTYENDSKQI